MLSQKHQHPCPSQCENGKATWRRIRRISRTNVQIDWATFLSRILSRVTGSRYFIRAHSRNNSKSCSPGDASSRHNFHTFFSYEGIRKKSRSIWITNKIRCLRAILSFFLLHDFFISLNRIEINILHPSRAYLSLANKPRNFKCGISSQRSIDRKRKWEVKTQKLSIMEKQK